MTSIMAHPGTLLLQNCSARVEKSSEDHRKELSNKDAIMPAEESLTVDALLRLRARQMGNEPIVAYPSSGIEYINYSPQRLNTFACRLAKHYAHIIPPRQSSIAKEIVVGILGPSNLEYLITLLALTKLGHTVLFLSTRLSTVAYVSLLNETSAKHLLVDDSFKKMAASIPSDIPSVEVGEIADRKVFEDGSDITAQTPLTDHLDPKIENTKIAWIIHSSGSTGLPKPIYQTHQAALKNYTNNMNMVGFITLPLFHAHGLSCLFRSLHARKKIMLYNASLPLAHEYLLGVLRDHTDIEIFYGVPYALKILAESPEGITALAKLKAVMSGGSACPDALGDRLVASGVNLVSHYGTTETGQLMTSSRPEGDKNWNYVRAMPSVRPFLRWEPQGANIYELVVLDGLKSKVASNRPDGAYATKDLFTPHPTTPNAWKYYARLDDTIILMNGEKAVPNLFEHEVRTNPNVSEAIIFGAGKSQLGMMIIPSEATNGFEKGVILGSILPSLEKANKEAPEYAQITTDMLRFLPQDTDLPKTDKGTIIRARFYKEFATQIDAVYEATEVASGDLALSEVELQRWLHEQLADTLNIAPEDLDDTADLFSFGVDSLRAIQLRSAIVKNIDTAGHALGSNIAFDYPSVNALAKFLYQLRIGDTSEKVSIEDQMATLIEKYSDFPQHKSVANASVESSIVVTGATGSLGAHIVAQLSLIPSVSKVYCLVRASSPSNAHQRVLASLRERKIYHSVPLPSLQKITALPSNFSHPDLGLSLPVYTEITKSLTCVIHCAWSVNFNLSLPSFESSCIAGVSHLLRLCLSAQRPNPASFNFCSSVSTVAATPSRHAPEYLPTSLSHAQRMGYAQSKLVAEHLCHRAAAQTSISARVLRVGQIIGDTREGIWNATEAIPLILQCALTIGYVPKLVEDPLWLPVDVVANAMVETSLSDAPVGSVMNIVNHRSFHWTRDLLPMLRKALPAEIEYREVDRREWIRRLRESNPDPVVNPPVKLQEFFEGKYDTDDVKEGMSYDTELARGYSPALEAAPVLDEEFLQRCVRYWLGSAWRVGEEGTYVDVVREYLRGEHGIEISATR